MVVRGSIFPLFQSRTTMIYKWSTERNVRMTCNAKASLIYYSVTDFSQYHFNIWLLIWQSDFTIEQCDEK